MLLLVAGLGLVTGFHSGLLGIGGGIVMAPLLLYLPPLLRLGPLTMREVAGLTIVQGLMACVAGALTHWKFRFVSSRLVLYMGASIFVAALIGGAVSKVMPNEVLLAVFGTLALAAALLMLLPSPQDQGPTDLESMAFSRPRSVVVASAVGLLGGLVGQGGSFILIPAMTSIVQIPTRIAIGSNLAIVLLSTSAAFLGKAFTQQIDWLLALPLVLTVPVAAYFGSLVSRRTPVAALRRVLAIVIAIAALRVWISVLANG